MKNIVKKMKSQATDWEKNICKIKSDKGPFCKMYKEHSKLSNVNAAAAAKSLQSCSTLCDPMDSSHQAPLSLGFSKQEYWSGLPFPSQTGYSM